MSDIKNLEELKRAISSLEDEMRKKRVLLNDQFLFTYEIFKPLNLLSSMVKRTLSPAFLIEKFSGPLLGMVAGYFFRKKA